MYFVWQPIWHGLSSRSLVCSSVRKIPCLKKWVGKNTKYTVFLPVLLPNNTNIELSYEHHQKMAMVLASESFERRCVECKKPIVLNYHKCTLCSAEVSRVCSKCATGACIILFSDECYNFVACF